MNRILLIGLGLFILFDILLAGYFFTNKSGFDLFKFEPRPGSCLILEEKYCRGVKFIKDPYFKDGLMAAYKVKKGAYLFAPIGGLSSTSPSFTLKNSNGQDEIYRGATIIISKDEHVENFSSIYSFVFYADQYLHSASSIKKGETIAILSDRPIRAIGDYNLVVNIIKQTHYKGASSKSSEDGKDAFINEADVLKKMLGPQ